MAGGGTIKVLKTGNEGIRESLGRRKEGYIFRDDFQSIQEGK